MKQLPPIRATAEQLPIISGNSYGAEVICGAAGSGKTTTALLRLRSLSHMVKARRLRLNDPEPVKVLLLTFNRTLAGYVRNLAESQLNSISDQIEINTFAKWALLKLGSPALHPSKTSRHLRSLAESFKGLDPEYLIKEVEYLLGRFEPDKIEEYVTAERTGRGALPRVDRTLRRRILDDVAYPYQNKLNSEGWLDWNTLAVKMATELQNLEYDIVIVDESQDFSANEIRAIRSHLVADHAVTFVIDTVQRVYARGFTWSEAGIHIAAGRSHRLRQNHRNTKEIAAFAAGVLSGIAVDQDGSLPDLNSATTTGRVPQILTGLYNQQLDWVIDFIRSYVDLTVETIGFLKPQGGKWFEKIESRLRHEDIPFVDITRLAEWPDGPENVALSTFHSAKGLEFDYVFILGLNKENTLHGEEEDTDQIRVLRNLLAVAVARARQHVVIGHKPGEESDLAGYFLAGTYNPVQL